jgi:hypothetical protein
LLLDCQAVCSLKIWAASSSGLGKYLLIKQSLFAFLDLKEAIVALLTSTFRHLEPKLVAHLVVKRKPEAAVNLVRTVGNNTCAVRLAQSIMVKNCHLLKASNLNEFHEFHSCYLSAVEYLAVSEF